MKKITIKNNQTNGQKFQNVAIAKDVQKQVKGGSDVIIIQDQIEV